MRPIEFTSKTRHGFHLRGTTTDLIQRYIYLYGIWEPNLTEWLVENLQPGDCFVDVGANIGYMTLLASQCVGEAGKVVSIEASPRVFYELSNNVHQNGAKNVRLINKAVAGEAGHVQLFSGPESNIGATSIYGDDALSESTTVEARSLADLLTAEEIEHARIIKIDVEGAELLAVNGLLTRLGETSEYLEIILEVGGGPATSPDAETASSEIIGRLAQRGFHAYQMKNDYSPEAYYLAATSRSRPTRLTTDIIDEEIDLIFSRRDQKTL